jgi:hypothetical protein
MLAASALVLCLSLSQVDAGVEAPIVAAPDAGAPDERAPLRCPTCAQEPADAPVTPTAQPPLSKVYLRDGQLLSGTVLATDAQGRVTLAIGGGATLEIPAGSIARIEVDKSPYRTPSGETWFRDVNRTRYMYAPSAMMLKRDELFFAQTELLLSGLSWGITDFLSLQVAGAVPIWFMPRIPENFNLVVGLKAGGSLTEYFHLAGGAQVLAIPWQLGRVGIVGLLFGTATVGTPDLHASLAVGVPLSSSWALGTGPPIGTLSGNWRLARSFALVTEHWFIFDTSTKWNQDGSTQPVLRLLMANGLAGRIMGERLAVDLGFVLLVDGGVGGVSGVGPTGPWLVVPFPIPWLNFVYNFGG